MSSKSVQQECQERVSSKECPARVSCNSVQQERQSRNVQECPVKYAKRVSSKSVRKSVKKECPARVSRKSVKKE